MPALELEIEELYREALQSHGGGDQLRPVVIGADVGHFFSQNGNNLEQCIKLSDVAAFGEKAPTLTGKYNGLLVMNALAEQMHDAHEFGSFLQLALSTLTADGVLIVQQNLAGEERGTVAKLTHFLDTYRTTIDGETVGFDFYGASNPMSSVMAKQNWLDFVWVLNKRRYSAPSPSDAVTFREFLDKTQYTDTGIGAYEWIFGRGFISPGGAAENHKFLQRLNLKPGERMLDVGVGIGGSPHQTAQEYGVNVVGVDLSSNMLAIAYDRAQVQKDCRVQFTIADVLKYNFPAESFDCVYSRDCIQHLDDTNQLFSRFHRWLKPGGRMLLTLYGRGSGKPLPEFNAYLKQRQYHLKELPHLIEVAESVGFSNVAGEDMTPRFKQILQQEIKNAHDHQTEFLQHFSREKFQSLLSGWQDKLGYIDAKNHCWISIYATKKH